MPRKAEAAELCIAADESLAYARASQLNASRWADLGAGPFRARPRAVGATDDKRRKRRSVAIPVRDEVFSEKTRRTREPGAAAAFSSPLRMACNGTAPCIRRATRACDARFVWPWLARAQIAFGPKRSYSPGRVAYGGAILRQCDPLKPCTRTACFVLRSRSMFGKASASPSSWCDSERAKAVEAVGRTSS